MENIYERSICFKKCLKKLLLGTVVTLGMSLYSYADIACKATYGNGDRVLNLATGSPGELGLVKVLD